MVNAGCRDKDLEHIGKHLAKARVGGAAQPRAPAGAQRGQLMQGCPSCLSRMSPTPRPLTLALHMPPCPALPLDSLTPPSFLQAAGKDVSMEVHDDRGLLALQGPSAVKVLQGLTSRDLSKLYFGMFDRCVCVCVWGTIVVIGV